MIKPGGRGYIALDIHAMVNRTSDDIVENLLKSTNLDDYVRNELDNLPCKVLVYDQSGFDFNDSTDGNLRIVFEKE